MFQFLAITTMSHVLKSIKRAMIRWCCQVPKRFSKRKLHVVNTKTNRPIHPQPTSSETYNPYAVIVPFTSVFLLELTVNTCRKKERPPTTLVAILNVRARSRDHASTNQTFFGSESTTTDGNLVPRVRVTLDERSGTRDSGIKRLPENKNPVIGQTAQASGIPTSGFTKCSHYSTRQLSFPWKNWG